MSPLTSVHKRFAIPRSSGEDEGAVDGLCQCRYGLAGAPHAATLHGVASISIAAYLLSGVKGSVSDYDRTGKLKGERLRAILFATQL